MSDLVVSTSLRDAKLDRDREIINLAKKLNQLRNLAELTERKAEALNDEGEKMDEYILSVKNDKQVATQLIDNLKEPYEAITSIVKDMAKEIGQLSRSKMNELRRMTKPPNLIKKTVELVCHLVKIESPNGAKYFNNETLPKLDWDRDCLPMLSSKNFLGDISTYRPSKLSSVEKLINLLKTQYLSQEEIEKMNLMTERKEENSGTSAKRSTLADSSAPARKKTTEENGGLKLPSISTIKRTNETNVKTLLSSIAITNTQQRKNEHISLTPANLSVSKVSYSSKTTGSLLKWCIGQLRYSEVLGVHDESVLQKVEDAKANVERAIVAIEERSIKQKSIKEEVEELDEKAGTINHEIEIILKMLEKFNKEKLNEERAIVEKCEEEKASRRRKEIEKTVSKTKSVPTPPKPPITPSVSNTFSFSSPAIEHPTVLVPLVGSVSISKIPVTVTQQLAFEEGSTKLTTVALKSLDGVLNVMNECESKICIESKQTASESAGVSEARACAVRQYLTSNGINPARLRTNAFIENSARFARQDARGNVVKKLSKQVSFYIIQELRLAGTIEFSQMSSDLKSSSHALLDDVVAILKSNPFMFLKIEGHTDNRPSWGQTNLELSDNRACAVEKYIVNVGEIEKNRLQAQGCGERLPLNSNKTSSGRQANRRVEFHLEDRKAQSSMRDLVRNRENSISSDENAVKSLLAIASGKFGGMGFRVRQCAADVLISSGVDWETLRFLYIASLKKEDTTKCFLGNLSTDVIRIIARWYFRICK